jgi:hypothetical protein
MHGGAISRTANASVAAAGNTTFGSFALSAGARYQVIYSVSAGAPGNDRYMTIVISSSTGAVASQTVVWHNNGPPFEFVARMGQDGITVTNNDSKDIEVCLIERMG